MKLGLTAVTWLAVLWSIQVSRGGDAGARVHAALHQRLAGGQCLLRPPIQATARSRVYQCTARSIL